MDNGITRQDEIVSELFIQLQIGNCCFDGQAPNIIGDRKIRISALIRIAGNYKFAARQVRN